MIRVVFDPAALQDPDHQAWWKDWQKRADDATDKVIEAFEKWFAGKRDQPFRFEFNSKIWKDVKDWLLKNVFYKKCAYCERIISGYYGDAEHYRPKAAVLRKTATGDFVEPFCSIADPAQNQFLTLGHPGYFWLAYDWRNLVPACVYCNSGLGKNERFDIEKDYVVMVKLDQASFDAIPSAARPRPSKKWPGHYYLSPTTLDQLEHPLLLNPLNAGDDRNPRKHIRFGVRGIVTAVKNTPIGRTSIEVFRLKDEDLRQERQASQENFGDKFYDKLRELDPENPGQSKAQTLLNEYSQGRYPFSAAALDYYEILYKVQPPPPPQ